MAGGTDMKKKYKLNEIDCANCAMKLEEAVKAVDGVTSAKVNYMMQKLTFEAEEGQIEQVEKAVLAVCHKLEPDMEVTPS